MSIPVTRLAAVLAAFALSLVLAAPVFADAELVASNPEDGATLAMPPTEVTLRFNEPIDGGKSSFRLIGPAGEVGTGRPTRDGGRVMSLVNLTLAPGDYEVRWTAGSEDGHLVRGRLQFIVAAPSPAPASPAPGSDAPAAPSGAPSDAPSAAPSVGAAPSPSAAPDDVPVSGSTGEVLLPIVVGLVLAGVGGAYLLRRNRAA